MTTKTRRRTTQQPRPVSDLELKHVKPPTSDADDVYEFPCGCRVRCLALSQFVEWSDEPCESHSVRTIQALGQRTANLIEAKHQRQLSKAAKTTFKFGG